MIGSWFWCSYFTFSVFRFTSTFLIRRFFPLHFRYFQNIDIIESKVACIVSSKYKQFILTNSTSSMLSTWLRNISRTSCQSPFTIALVESQSVHLIVRTYFIVLPVSSIQPTKHHMKLTYCRHGMSRPSCRDVSCSIHRLKV